MTPPAATAHAREASPGELRSMLDEVRRENQVLRATLETMQTHQAEWLARNRELADANRGIVTLYADLDEKVEHLRRADEIKSRFLSNIIHEFRTPLNAVRALTHVLLQRMDGQLTGEQEKQVAYIRQAADDLSALVDDLLDLAKVGAGKTAVRPTRFEVVSLFRTLRGMMEPLTVNPNVALSFEEPPGLLTLTTDEATLCKILRNLVSNAVKFTELGTVRVSAALNAGGDAVVFSVADTGIGIAPGDQERIFQEFSQVDSPIQNRMHGTGLGLSLSRRLAELLGGSLTVTSARGVGSTFVATIPIVYRAAPRILVIDDEEDSRYHIRELLDDVACLVIEAGSGREGIMRAQADQPDAIVLDLVMPGMSGLSVLARLGSETATRDIPVIVMTPHELEDASPFRRAAAVVSKDAGRGVAGAAIRAALAKSGLVDSIGIASVPAPDA